MNAKTCSPELISAAMYSALAAHDLGCAAAFSELYSEPADQTVAGQIASANQFWRLQLGSAQVSTVEVRECLVDDIDHHDWVRLFASEVAPVISALNLPRGNAAAAAR